VDFLRGSACAVVTRNSECSADFGKARGTNRENTRHQRFVRRARLNSDHHVIQMALLILDIMQSAHGAACFADKCCLHRASSSSF
jgi:hypothetical protein